MKVKWKLDEGVKLSRGTPNSAGIDIHVNRTTFVYPGINFIDLGVKAEIEAGYFALISIEKSSIAAKRLSCHAGLIDSDYREGWVLVIVNDTQDDIVFTKGCKICQVVFLPVTKVESEYLNEGETFNTTERSGGFGSTGHS